ncbi:phage portal protein [Pelagimonas varians]|uniref:Phage portal protein, lambda family n=1 Tax=Pelagimonas varians TaxID=696760 RepID=A0A238KCR7_9RHOB|nr:phage portal protein [Pelagimonas varians]PYG29974.1 lambda family phage portal protein [Pelagimonas varians]SMX40599.1 Phage portal protein, lambda family [Pelagimonas varians]
MSFLDKAILAISPERGLRRVKARSAAQTVMNFDAASRGRRTRGWKAPGTSADAAGMGSRSRLRNLSRDMIRNRALAVRGRDVITGNVVGTGILPSVRMDNPNDAEAAMDVLRQHLLTAAIDAHGTCDVLGLQRVVMNTVFCDGEVLVRRRMRDPRLDPDLTLPFQIELLEADHLDETLTSHGKNEVIEGIEYGPTGRIEAYHLFPRHPGEIGRLRSLGLKSSRVPAKQMLHIRRVDRPGQMRGVPWLAPIMMTLGEISDYQEAQILKQKIAALLAFFISASSDGKVYDGKPLQDLQPGAIVGLEEGQTVHPSQPPTVDGYQEFMNQAIRTIAMGLGLSYESFGDLRGVNYSSGKMGRLEMDRFVEVWQKQLMIAQFCTGVGNWVLEAWPLVQRLPAAPKEIAWTAPKRPLIDPPKEIKAAAEEIKSGITSRQRKQREMGYDPDVIERERREDAARDQAMPDDTSQSEKDENNERD